MLEEPERGQRIAVRRESVVAFVGAAPRGPVGIPVAVHGIDEYQRRFGAPGYRGHLKGVLSQFFENGGTRAVVVRVSDSERRHRIVMPGPAGDLVLIAVNPGPHECLRASIDYDGIPADEDERFNLVVHRLPSRDRPIVESQEIFRALTIDPGDPDFFADALLESDLVRADERAPMARPDTTHRPGIDVGAAYRYSDDQWREQPSLTDYDLIGSDSDGTGIFALDRVSTVDIVCLVPDTEDLGPVAMFAADRYCRNRHALLFVDPPSTWKSVGDVVQDRLRSVFRSANVVTYFPRPAAVTGAGQGRASSALGALLGGLVAGDPQHGVWGLHDPLTVRCRERLSVVLDDREEAALRRLGVNALRECAGGYVQVRGLVTMDNSTGFESHWSDLHMRRTGLFILGSIARGTRWAAFADDNEQTWDEVRRQVTGFLEELSPEALHTSDVGGGWYVTRDRDVFGRDARGTVPGLASFVVGFALSGEECKAFRFVQGGQDCDVQPVGWQPRVALAS